jgi:hypothetical protein
MTKIPLKRVKAKHTAKHASLLKKSDFAYGLLVSCDVKMEMNALTQIAAFADEIIRTFDYVTTWPTAIDSIDYDDDDKVIKRQRIDRLYQFVDSGCAGLMFIRLRVNINPVDLIMKAFGLFIFILYLELVRNGELDHAKLKNCHVIDYISINY